MTKPTPPTDAIDPITFARFIVMPGLNDLLDAFGRIPPGPMRASVIHLAKTLADQYSNAPAEYAMPDPLLTAAGAPPVTQLESPAKQGKPPGGTKSAVENSPEAEVIRRRKKGQHAQKIAADLHIPRSHVDRMLSEAKKAGITFPSLRGSYTGQPMERKEWHTSLDTMRGQGISRVEAAAAARGISPQQYLDRKLLAVDMAQKGASYDEMEKATKTDQKTISLWLSNARAAGLKVPYAERVMSFQAEQAASAPEKPVQADPAPDRPSATIHQLTPVFAAFDALSGASKAMVRRAAERRNLTPQAYLDVKESVARQRMAGVNPTQIVTNSGESPIFVKDTLQEAKARGAVFPPCKKGWNARTA